jgi:uncharacterized protein (TIGR02466 family)
MENLDYVFGIPTLGLVLAEQRLQSIDYINKILDVCEKTPSVKKSNTGWQSDDYLGENNPIFKELISQLTLLCDNFCSSYFNKKISGKIEEFWANVNPKGAVNFSHSHGGDLSGIFYLQVNEESGDVVFLNPAISSRKEIIASQNLKVHPRNLVLLLFPSWLEHYVEPNQSEEPRISLSFNYHIMEISE